MTIFVLLSVLVSLAALFSFVSYRLLKLPTTVGVMLLSLGCSMGLILVGRFAPSVHRAAESVVAGIDFPAVLLHGMLGLLLFAGALHLDLGQLIKDKLPVLSLSIVSTVLSTAIVAVLLKFILELAGLPVSISACLLFGALISPTDPIAVLEMLRRVGAPRSLETQLAGESLLNDGVGAVLFLSLLDATSHNGLPQFDALLVFFIIKAGGGLVLGSLLGYFVARLLSLVEGYRVEVLLTLGLAMGGYALADVLHISAPLEAVAAGLMISGSGRRLQMSSHTREHVDTFWELVDDILNVLLFLLVGLQLLVMPWDRHYLYAGLLAILAVLFARWSSVGAVVGALRMVRRPVRGTIVVLTWGGLRGGLSIALALSLAPGQIRNELLAITYVVVIFSIVIQGLTVGPLLSGLGLARRS
jgi:monovalent cation:H+ antiporter, CPA1 family